MLCAVRPQLGLRGDDLENPYSPVLEIDCPLREVEEPSEKV